MKIVDDPRPWRNLLLVPVAVSLLLFLVPQYYFISSSFHQNLGYGRIGDALTLVNYERVFGDTFYVAALVRTAALALCSALLCMLIGFPVAYVLARAQSKWISLLLGLLVASSLITPVVKDLGLIILLTQGGVVNGIMMFVGLLSRPVAWLGSDAGVLVGLVHYALPLMVLLLHTVIQTVPRSLEDAAHVHGASRWRVYWAVILPIVRPGLMAAGLMAFNLAMGAFTTPALLGGGRVFTFPILIQRTVVLDVDYPFAATLSSVLLVFVLCLNILAGYLLARQVGPARKVRAKKKKALSGMPKTVELQGAQS